MKILYLAFACNPFAGSEAQCGWAWPMVMRKYAEVAVLTRKENRSDIERFLEEKAIKNIKVFYHDIPEWMNFYYKKGKGYHLYYLLWQKSSVKIIRKLNEKYHFDYIHQVTLGDFRSFNGSWKLGTKFIFGPVGGAQVTPSSLKSYVEKDLRTEKRREAINNLVGRIPSYKRALNATELVFSANRETQLFLQKYMKKPENCKLLTENGVLQEMLQGVPTRVVEGKCVLLWAGRMVNKKGLAFLLDVIASMKTESAFVLKLIGDGPEMERLKKQAESLNIQNKVEFLGKISYEKMKEAYISSDIFVFPSLRETTGTVLFEAMSSGLPVITFNQNGADILIDDTCGRKIDINQNLEGIIKDFASSITELVDDASMRRKLGAEAYKRIETKYTWEEKCKKFYLEYLK